MLTMLDRDGAKIEQDRTWWDWSRADVEEEDQPCMIFVYSKHEWHRYNRFMGSA